MNTYAYVGGNPINLFDFYGLSPYFPSVPIPSNATGHSAGSGAATAHVPTTAREIAEATLEASNIISDNATYASVCPFLAPVAAPTAAGATAVSLVLDFGLGNYESSAETFVTSALNKHIERKLKKVSYLEKYHESLAAAFDVVAKSFKD